jgi:YD repeat-containing protein
MVEQEVRAEFAWTDPVTGHSQWTAKYEHDANGNVLTQTDARGVTMTFDYDELNRLLSKTASGDAAIVALTPTATYSYDDPAIPNSKGRMTKAERGGLTWEALEYDAMGRLRRERHTVR